MGLRMRSLQSSSAAPESGDSAPHSASAMRTSVMVGTGSLWLEMACVAVVWARSMR